ncbi:MAG TPA: TolC family protein, partial [Thermomicrobiales bacterium]|nr:TolC family protein [Thermomicrobiales bacterium]
YALAVLVGNPPEERSDLLRDETRPSAKVPIFVAQDPKALLRRRPDVAAAERRVAAATASIGVTTAELFPSVTLIGNVGLEAGRSNDLTHGNSVKYIAGPTLTWNILDFGRIRSRIEQADARNDRALAAYEQVILKALQEAESALVAVDRVDQQAAALAASTDAARDAAHLAQLRFEAGATDLLDLLDAQRQVLDAEDRLTRVETAREAASVNLYKAMGGGWSNNETSAAPIARTTTD